MPVALSDWDRQMVSRRQALAGMGSVSLGAILVACGADDSASTTSAEVATTEGTTATVETRTGKGLANLFDSTSACTLTPEQTQGPYYFDANKIRSDVREDRTGTELRVVLRVRGMTACRPIKNAVVEIWHADAGGIYSGFEAASNAVGGPGQGARPQGGGPPPGSSQGGIGGGAGQSNPTDNERYLRGAQVTDANGIVEFTTVYPGWYQGRAPHIHAMVHIDNASVLTTQLFFDDALSSQIYEQGDPYKADAGRTTNDQDGIFDPVLIMDLSKENDAYLGTLSFDVATV